MASFSFDSARTVEEIFHRFHLPGINSQYNEEYWIWNMVAQGSDPDVRFETNQFGGTDVRFALELTRQPGFGPISDGGTLNTGKLYTVEEAHERIWEMHQPVRLTGSAQRMSQSNLGSYERYMTNTVNNATQALFQKLCWLMYAKPAGGLAQVSTAVSLPKAGTSTPIAFDNEQVDTFEFMADMIGERFAFVTGPNAGSSTVVYAWLRSVSQTGALSFGAVAPGASAASSNVAVPNNAWLMLDTYDTTNHHSQLPFGLGQIADDRGTLHDVSGATHPRWAPTQYNDSTFGETVFDRAIREIKIHSGTVDGICAIVHPKLSETIAHTLTNDKRYVNTTSPQAGVQITAVQAGPYSVPLVVDHYCPENKAFMISKNDLMKLEAVPGVYNIRPPGSGNNWVHELTSSGGYRDSYQMWMGVGYALGTKHRNRHGCITKT